MQTIPYVSSSAGGKFPGTAGCRQVRELQARDRSSRPPRRAAETTPGSCAGRLPAHDAGATGRPAVRPPLRGLPPRRQRTRTAAGLSLALLALAAVVVSGSAAVAVVAAAAAAAGALLARLAFGGGGRQHPEDLSLVEELPFVTYTARLADSRPEYVSPQIERLLEMTAEQALAVGDFWTPRLHPLDRERVLRHWRAWCADPAAKPFRRTYRMLTESGRVVWIEDVTVLVGGSPWKRRTYRRHLFDVTERHELEEQLRDTQKHEALGRVAGAVAHDFNNLLTVIAGYAERLKSGRPEPAARDDAVAIAAAAERGTALVRQLLSFARPRPSDLRVIDLNAVVADFAPMVRRVIGEDIELVLGFERNPLPVELDPARFDQVLMNLVVNARDAMPDGGRLTIGTAAVVVDGSEDGSAREWAALVSISDTGVGIDAEAADRIFDPFFTTKQHGRGSGLGLATVQSIVNEVGGSLDLSSTPGRGTTFWIYLPLATAELEQPSETEAAPAAAPGGQEAVLLVEDEAALRELEQVTLEEAGYEVYAAADAAEALELAAKHGLDLMVVDVVLPGMNGPQLVEELAARGFDFPAVFVSGYGSDEIASRGLNARGDTVIQKPFQAETLLRAVRAELDRAAATVTALPTADDAAGHEPDRDAEALQSVRCLACGARYRRPTPPFSLSRSSCPSCEYVGWAAVE